MREASGAAVGSRNASCNIAGDREFWSMMMRASALSGDRDAGGPEGARRNSQLYAGPCASCVRKRSGEEIHRRCREGRDCRHCTDCRISGLAWASSR